MKLGTYKLEPIEGGTVLAERPRKFGLSALHEALVLDVDDTIVQDLDDIVVSFVYITVRREKTKTAVDASTSALGWEPCTGRFGEAAPVYLFVHWDMCIWP